MMTHEPTQQRPLLVIVGPTAGGKTALSVALAKELGGACISADSMQIYQGMDIGTATPTVQEQGGVDHHLLSFVSPQIPFSVDDWLKHAGKAINEVRAKGQWPIVVGGTNLYVQALLFGMADGPPPQPALRAELSTWTPEALHQRLQELDPNAARRIHVNDRRRTIRAIEIASATGEPGSDQQHEWSGQCRDDAVVIGLHWATEAVNRRINARVKWMMDAGLLDEVRQLHEKGLLGEQAAEAVGYKQLIEHLEGRCTLEEAIEQIKIKSRRLGKQQRTWLRRFQAIPLIRWLDANENKTQVLVKETLAYIHSLGIFSE
ncbi:MAG: tRNA (adenosine(37)-N6)-dimethylallyltransferase MiaA [Phycisphaerales bacterium]|nr:tRNA (adenosine(37)-N6)-dimethylallyltransferase MiaA [Phycisphaerales bacterium]